MFHVGNFRTAWIAQQWAQFLSIPLVIRFEDIDVPRVVAGAQERQLAEMQQFGIRGDRVEVQSSRRVRHWVAFLEGLGQGWIYPCFCSRNEVRAALDSMASAPHRSPPLYSGHCRNLRSFPSTDLPSIAWRFRGEEVAGTQDFIVARSEAVRASGLAPAENSFVPAYNWACAVDDMDGNHTLLVRAWDLEEVTAQQRAIQLRLGAHRFAAVFHTALITQNDGHRLEKRTRGVTFSELLAAGYDVDRIQVLFRNSFQIEVAKFAPQSVFGESHRTLSLQELGFKV